MLSHCYRTKCTEILTQVTTVMEILERADQPNKLYEKVDLFFYVSMSAKMKASIRDLKVPDPDPNKFNELKELYATFKLRWQNDYKYIATPATLHQYL